MNLMMADVENPEPGGDEDTRLLVAARDDLSAFAELYTRNADKVLAFFYRRTLCAPTSYDLMAETFARALRHRHRYRPTGASGVAWIFGIARNLYRDWLRREVVSDKARRRLRIQTPELIEDDLSRIDSLVSFVEFREDLREALERLTPKLKDAVLMRVADDCSYEEVADALGCSVGAARVRVSRALDRLLVEMGVEE